MKRMLTGLLIAAVLLALPFWAILLLPLPMRALEALGARAPALNGLVAAPHFGATLLLADLTRYVIISAGALIAALAAAGLLIARGGFSGLAAARVLPLPGRACGRARVAVRSRTVRAGRKGG